ncbi:MAG: A/G-specific adenine glycosylase [Acidimicrobiia bacterium]|nr:A/G-specific adenine glycosylase [Acidimicrobiia bacterium]
MTASGRNAALLDWYDENGRDLPWRRTRDRWQILIAEVMLQQTQVSRVVPVFERFVARYPNPQAFAVASPEEVIEAWEGLGYLRRARRLQAAAKQIADRGWPADLRELPGVGRYTAAAVAVFADGSRRAAVDVNLRRIVSRWTGVPLGEAAAFEAANELVDPARPGDWNQAMMDLGSTLCRPTRPRCPECPVAQWCVDPTIEITVPRQSAFQGSVRQARAAVLKGLVGGPAPQSSLAAEMDDETVARAIASLLAEGAIESDGAVIRLA